MYSTEFTEQGSEKTAPSNEDKQFLNVMKESVTINDGHYELPLPFRNAEINLPNDRIQALKRL